LRANLFLASLTATIGHTCLIEAINKSLEGPMEFIWELWTFLRVRKKLWILPIMAIAALLGGVLVFGQSSALAPFIYTLF
jgi:hypothetical protein